MSSGSQEEGGCEMKPATIQEQTATCRKLERRFARLQRCQLGDVTDTASWSYLYLRDEAQTGDYRGSARVSKRYRHTHIAIISPTPTPSRSHSQRQDYERNEEKIMTTTPTRVGNGRIVLS
jgi:hypothetical protein